MSTSPQTRPKPAPRVRRPQSPAGGHQIKRSISPLVHTPHSAIATTRDDSALPTHARIAAERACTVRRSGSFNDREQAKLWNIPPKDTKNDSAPSSLAKFVQTYQTDFPMCVQITGGTRIGLSVGAIYTFHFIKNTRVINVQDGKGVAQFCIPLNSSVQIGIVYPPVLNSENHICRNIAFKGVKEIMTTDPLPKILRAANSCVDDNPSFTLVQNELLIVKKVLKSRPFGQQKLVTYSLTNNTTKVLRENCNVLFLTGPESVLVYPVEFFAHFHDSMPLKAILQFSDDAVKTSLSQVITLADSGVVRSIIATPFRGKDAPPPKEWGKAPLLEIPLDTDVELERATVPENDDMCSESLELIRGFDPKRVISMAPSAAPTVDQILSAGPGGGIRQGYEKMGLELESALINSRSPAKLPETEGQYSTPHDCLPSWQSSEKRPAPSTGTAAEATGTDGGGGNVDLRMQLNVLQRTVEIMQHQMDSVENMARKSNSLVGLVKAEVAQIATATKQLITRVDALSPYQNGPLLSPKGARGLETPAVPPLPNTTVTSSADKDMNKKLLAQLSCIEVK